MSKLTLDSKKFQNVLHNLRLENLSLSNELQKKILKIVNDDVKITPEIIKGIVADGKI